MPVTSCDWPNFDTNANCSSDADRVRWVNSAIKLNNMNPNNNFMYGVSLTIGTVRLVANDAGGWGSNGYYAIVLDDAFTIAGGGVSPRTSETSVIAYACNHRSFVLNSTTNATSLVRGFGSLANLNARFRVGRKVLLFTTSIYVSSRYQLFASACEGEVYDACLVKGQAGCFNGLARAQLINFASIQPTVARLFNVGANVPCSPACQNGGTCKFGDCICSREYMGDRCETRRPPAPAVTITPSRIVPGAGGNATDVWIAGTTRKIKIPILSKDRTIPTGFARVMLLNLSPNPYCGGNLRNATVDGLPAWFFADSSEIDPTSNPRYLFTQLLQVVDLSKLKWFPGTKAKATIEVQHTLSTDSYCKSQGSGYRIAVMLSATRSDDAQLAGPFAGGQFTLANGGCIGDGVAGVCRSDSCANYGTIAAQKITAGQCVGAENACCIPDRSDLSASTVPLPLYTFFGFDLPRARGSNSSGSSPVPSFSWGETVPLKWRVNTNRPQASPFQLFWPDGFCAVEEGLDAPSATFDLQLRKYSADGPLIKSFGKKALSLGKFDAQLQLPLNDYNPGSVIFVAKFSDSCMYASAMIPTTETPCFSTATKTLVGTCMSACAQWGDNANAIGTCTGLSGASKCCGKIRNSNDGFRFADEDDADGQPESPAASNVVAAAAAGIAMTAAML
jgi:hypothetical protein